MSQLLPSPGNLAPSSKPIFERVLEGIQGAFIDHPLPYITITHVLPHQFAMDDVPSSPPVTPNLASGGDDYFGQSVFSLGAKVPMYHTPSLTADAPISRLPNPVVVPGSVQVSVLERYIPPTSAQEYDEFFGNNGQSHLVDRLIELSVDGGTLLLIYPTRTGADTFQSQYLAPILEPFLRQFIFSHGMTHDLATEILEMKACPEMDGFDEMKTRLSQLCHDMSSRALPRARRSKFQLLFSEVTHKVLDRAKWTDWYIAQEQARIRMDIIRYQHGGGRMPLSSDDHEVTEGHLTRRVMDEIRRAGSTEHSRRLELDGDGIPTELGVFVIQRTLL